MRALRLTLTLAALGAVGLAAYSVGRAQEGKNVDGRLFEMRIYYAAPGKMDALHARFRDHTCTLFKKHGMGIVGFWSPTKPEEAEQKLIYILSHASKDAADRSWKSFREDPAWISAKNASEKNGKLVAKVEQVFMNATDYSPLK
jgi:hypothetical protein